MQKTKFVWLALALLVSFSSISAQRKELKGQLLAEDEVEGIHILNKTALKYTVSNEDGSFIILAKESDTLFISGLKYESKNVVISKIMMQAGKFEVPLVEKVNELDEVILGKLLTGSLESDIENSEDKAEINFYDLGIPGYKGKPLTQNERKLHDADAGSWGYVGIGFGVNFHKLLNSLSGRTKKLRAIVEIDNSEECISRLRREFSEAIFETDTLEENLKNEYFYFCQEDEKFMALCQEQNDLKAIEFLKQKLKDYKEIKQTTVKD